MSNIPSHIKTIYIMILAHGWYISEFYDKFDQAYLCFVLRNPDCTKRKRVRFPLRKEVS